MSIRFYNDSSLTTQREFTFLEFWDPRQNRIWDRPVNPFRDPSQYIPAKDYVRIIQELPYLSLIEQYPAHMLGNIFEYTTYDTTPQMIDTFFRDVDPADLFVLFFGQVRSIELANNTIKFQHAQFSNRLSNIYSTGHKYINVLDHCTNRYTTQSFASKLHEIAETYRQVFSQITDTDYFELGWINAGNTRFSQNFTTFLFGQNVYIINNTRILGRNLDDIPLDTPLTIGEISEQQLYRGHWPTFTITQRVSKTFRAPLYNILQYSASATDLINWPIVEANEKNPVLYGVELETASDYDIRKIIDAQVTPFFIAKQDSTISGNGRTKSEFVTVPMSLKAQKKHWAHWFRNIEYDQFDCTKDTNNGMHVHIDRKAFMNEHHLKNMVWFYTNPANKDFLVYISERGSLDKLARYSPIITYPNSLSKVQAYKQCINYASRERGIVNLMKDPTIEVRMFRGILSFGELCKNLEFVDAVFHFCEGEHSVNKLSFVDFLTWLSKQPMNKYTLLRKFIDECKSLDAMIKEAEIKSIIFNLTDSKLIAQRLNKYAETNRLRITNAHVSILNRGQKRKYVLNKETGLVDLALSNLSKFARYDRDIETRYTRHAIA